MTVRIVDVREVTKPIASPIRNAYIDFSKMTSSLVAVVTNVVRDGPAGGRLRLQLQRSLWPGRADARAVRGRACSRLIQHAARYVRREHRP